MSAAALARCEQEQREILNDAERGDLPAWLVVLGLEDWEMEKRLILKEHKKTEVPVPSWSTGTAGGVV